MDIKKEREAFEAWYRKEYDNTVIDDSEFSEILDEYESNYYWVDELNQSWKAWQAAKAHEAEKLKGCVLVPVQCPDPDFADSLFDELSKKAIGEFGDDLLIHFSDIDEEKIWALMVGAAKAQAVPEVINVGNELQSWVAVWSFKARHDREDYIVVDANLLADKIEKLTGANA